MLGLFFFRLLASRLSPEMGQSKVRLLVGPEPLYKAMALKKVSPWGITVFLNKYSIQIPTPPPPGPLAQANLV